MEGIVLCAVDKPVEFAGKHMEERENNFAMMRLVLEMASEPGG